MKKLFGTSNYNDETIIKDILLWSSDVGQQEILGLIRILLCQYKSVPSTFKSKDKIFDLLNNMVEAHREYEDKQQF